MCMYYLQVMVRYNRNDMLRSPVLLMNDAVRVIIIRGWVGYHRVY